ncbi:MAG: cadherin-like domain-containing protein, partial [Robiginitomaculum sp.]|nr:cadherin-like domain-containing protein [Robiginitomaculum sp.]
MSHYFFGTNSDDTITGNHHSNIIFAFGGNDIVYGLGGHDWIFGFSGNDYLDGGSGNDRLYGGSGNDTLIGGLGYDRLYGGSGDDVLSGGVHNDRLYGGTGNDSLDGGSGNDRLYGQDGDDILDGGTGNDRLYGGDDEDTLNGGAGDDRLYGGDDEDTLYGGAGNDRLYGGDDEDTLNGGAGNDRLYGGDDEDTLYGGAGNDRLYGGDDDDILDGGAGSDYVNAGRGDDTLIFDSTENAGVYNYYKGSRGIDTLVLHLTQAEFDDANVAADLLGFLQHIVDNIHGNGQVWGPSYTFGTLNLRVHSIEDLRVFVGGVEVDPNDAGNGGNDPVAINDAFTTGENTVLADDVTANDTFDAGTSVTLISGVSSGTLVLNADGTFSFDPGTDFDGLALGESATETFVYELSGGGTTNQATATITITGANHAPTVAAVITAGANEDDAGFTLDMLAGASDVDNGAVLSVANVTGLAAGVIFAGSTLTVDPSDASFQSLALGETLDIIVSYDVVDEHGASVAQTATITITGTNDAPTVGAALTASANEDDAGFTIDMLTGASDIDTSDVLSVANVTGLTSGVTLSGTTLNVDPSDAAFQSLALGEVLNIIVSYDVVDGNGGSAPQTATITITGANDAPIVNAVTGNASEDGPAITLTADFSDVDASDTHTFSVDVTGATGLVTDNGDGTFGYDPNGGFESLAVGETATDTFTYTVTDNNGASTTNTVTITITGTNDAPIVAAALTASANEDDASLTVDMLAGASDVDNGAILSVANVTGLTAGVTFAGSTLTVDPADNAFQSLAMGAVLNIVISYDVVDQHGASVAQTATITITGTNDAPIVAAALTAAANEDDASFTVDMLTGASDIDAGDVLSVANVAGLTAGVTFAGSTLTIDPADAAFQSLALGEVLNIVVSYDVVDGNGGSVAQTATITITGANDAPTVAAALTASANEDDAGFTIDMLTGASDIDTSDVLSVANVTGLISGVTLSGTTLNVDPSDAAFQSLALGEVLNIIVSYDVVDGNGG